MAKIEIYIRPLETPPWIDDGGSRICYAGMWVDFKDGVIRLADADGVEVLKAKADSESIGVILADHAVKICDPM